MSLPKAERHSGLLTISSQNSTEDNKVPLYPILEKQQQQQQLFP